MHPRDMLHSVGGKMPSHAVILLISACLLWSLPTAAQNEGKPGVQSSQPRIVPPSQNYQFPNGKKFVYTVEWHVLTAGTATLRLDSDGAEEKLTATANSAGTVNLIFPVRSWFEGRIDPKTFCSTRIFKHSEEGKRKKETQIKMDTSRGKSVLDEKNLKTGETRQEEEDAPLCAADILSGFFYLASLPLSPGSSETLPVVDGGKTTIVQAKVEAREEIKVQAGDFHTIRVSLEPVSGKFQGKGEIWVWYSDDAARTPIQMRAKLAWGTVMFKLQRIEK
jgi:Protein of unknown function (DUF3108)